MRRSLSDDRANASGPQRLCSSCWRESGWFSHDSFLLAIVPARWALVIRPLQMRLAIFSLNIGLVQRPAVSCFPNNDVLIV
jgi:hypothetical protein